MDNLCVCCGKPLPTECGKQYCSDCEKILADNWGKEE